MTTTSFLMLLLVISAVLIAYFDFTKSEFSSLLLLVNYLCICFLTSYWMLLGVIVIYLCYKYKTPIDWLYVAVLCYLIIIKPHTVYMNLAIVFALIFILASPKEEENVNFMMPLELAIIAALA